MSEVVESYRKYDNTSSSSSIDDLPDDLLIDIFCRLPYESVFWCKRVSRRWFFLISDPKFAAHHKLALWTFMVTMKGDHASVNDTSMSNHVLLNVVTSRGQPSFESPKFFLDFLPCRRIRVAATFKDLVLCYGINDDDANTRQRVYFICNPLTKQWVALPSSALLPNYDQKSRAALICDEPYYHGTVIKGLNNVEYKFRVVVIHPFPVYDDYVDDPLANNFNLIIFCSESNCWKTINLTVKPAPSQHLADQSFPFEALQGVVCNGMLCLFHYLKFGAAFDPFKITANTCDGTTLKASTLPYPQVDAKLVECGGALLSIGAANQPGRIVMKKLEYFEQIKNNPEYQNNNDVLPPELKWKLIRLVDISRAYWEDNRSILPHNCNDTHRCRVIGVHPTNHDLVYLLVIIGAKKQLFLCNMKSVSLKPLRFHLPGQLVAVKRIELQGWRPTPIASITKANSHQLKLILNHG